MRFGICMVRFLSGSLLVLASMPGYGDAGAYAEFLKGLDPGKEESIALAIGRYLLDVAPKPVAERDAGYVAFRDFYEKSRQRLEEVIEIRLGFSTDEFIDEYSDESRLLNRVGLRFAACGEGVWTLLPVPGYMEGIFAAHVSEAIRVFMKLHEPEAEGVFAADAGVSIPLRGLADRVGAWDTYISEYPDSPLKKAAREALAEYFGWFFFGCSNTFVFGDVEGYLDAYRFYVSKYPKTKTASYVQKYLDLLERNGGKETPEVEAYEKELHDYVSSVGTDWALEISKPTGNAAEVAALAAAENRARLETTDNRLRESDYQGRSKEAQERREDFDEFLDKLDKSEASSVLTAVGKVWVITTGMVTKNDRDGTFWTFLRFYNDCLSEVEKRLRKESESAGAEGHGSDPRNNGALVKELERCGFQVLPRGTTWALAPKKDFVSGYLGGLVSAEYESFFRNRNLEMGCVFLHDDELGVSPQELADRIGRWETFDREYRRGRCGEAVWMLLADYLPLFMFGTASTPAYKADSGVRTQYKDAHAYFLRQYPRAGVAELLRNFAVAMAKEGSNKAEVVGEYRKKLATYLNPYEEFPVVSPRYVAEFFPERPPKK